MSDELLKYKKGVFHIEWIDYGKSLLTKQVDELYVEYAVSIDNILKEAFDRYHIDVSNPEVLKNRFNCVRKSGEEFNHYFYDGVHIVSIEVPKYTFNGNVLTVTYKYYF